MKAAYITGQSQGVGFIAVYTGFSDAFNGMAGIATGCHAHSIIGTAASQLGDHQDW